MSNSISIIPHYLQLELSIFSPILLVSPGNQIINATQEQMDFLRSEDIIVETICHEFNDNNNDVGLRKKSFK